MQALTMNGQSRSAMNVRAFLSLNVFSVACWLALSISVKDPQDDYRHR